MKSDLATVVYTWQVKPNKHEAMVKWLHGISQEAIKFPGHLGVTTIHQPSSNTYNSVLRFDNQKDLDAWLNADIRAAWLKKLNGIATEKKAKLSGLETWFEVPGVNPPPKWKMCIATFIGVYPIALVLGWYVAPHLIHLNFFVRELLFPIVAPILLTYLLLPFITQRLLKQWLYKPS